ncbi:hypothetical protein PVAND_003252 [Polypedilum vanderplanki]|uniref:Leucine-rich repeat protein n=1 Tax=Polypedilum vanderplanki TaxID=319348 RepID=A0A9J6BTH3_POLVA|nr:hypothetical protein PVAND_003252 [Polypedilum vanderplanki]
MIYELHPDLLINLTKLKYFNMESNNIEVLNEGSFRNNPLIEEILLGSNEILNIDVDFSLLAHVKIIYLSNNFDMCNFNLEIYESEPRETKKLLKNLFQTKVEEFCRYLVL